MEEKDVKEEGKYIYCIIKSDAEKSFGPMGIGGDNKEVHTIGLQGIGVVTSSSPVKKYSISRVNTIAHQKVMEEAMKEHTILPVKFGTVAMGRNGMNSVERIKSEVIKARYEEIKGLLARMDNKIELGLKALWIDMKVIFEEIVNEDKEIKRMKEKAALNSQALSYGDTAAVGEKVKNVLDKKREKEAEEILNDFKGVFAESRQNKIFGDNMITNSAFLVDKSRVAEFDSIVEQLDKKYQGRIRFKYVGPIPPCNFVELVITLGKE